ncbi:MULTISPECIES: potassium channel beta subunit family protein [Pedobacter]|uniref:Aldo/keto reductase n=1 Tax=Pedobacter heparinus (strain ATCC 13125 / DSM 2366 / CIP 104194 / JCM 7457 / NBRC 12017 / NCIMB 9290 / NRRL B-14731 / HIM 762-3) TaxID=485917 RepID=C6Y2J4_PEDHD|nr:MULTISPECIES: aldo/keto reductase [Pedobacter]ACU05204.1 aldo/keto reductase [Pedobacter heparinus DSM 2366]MBB5439255.1 voltage-dependent potassium channel beta subunit [Pedobacter sp. AK017]
MEYRRLGKSGLQVSALSLGSWLTFGQQISDKTADELMGMAYDAGVNFFDNAEGYAAGKSEIVMGKILKAHKWERESFVVSSKVFFGTENKGPNRIGLSRKHVIEACNGALKRLQVDYLDLYFCHRPDRNTPIEETVWAMNGLLQQGKILYWGTSEWNAVEIMEAIRVAKQYNLIGPTMEQPQYNLMERNKLENEYLLLFKEHGLGTTIWSPLASGLLSGKYTSKKTKDTRLELKGMEWLKDAVLNEEKLKKAEKLQALADKLNVPLAKLSLAWCLKNPNVSTVILGASKTEQLKENLTALEVLPLLTDEVMDKIEDLVQTKPKVVQF